MKNNSKASSNHKILPKIRNKLFSDLPKTHTLNRRNTVTSDPISKKTTIKCTNNNNQIKKRSDSKKMNDSFRVLNSASSSNQRCSSDQKFTNKFKDKKRINRPITKLFDQKIQNKKIEFNKNDKGDLITNAILTTNCTDITEEKKSNNKKFISINTKDINFNNNLNEIIIPYNVMRKYKRTIIIDNEGNNNLNLNFKNRLNKKKLINEILKIKSKDNLLDNNFNESEITSLFDDTRNQCLYSDVNRKSKRNLTDKQKGINEYEMIFKLLNTNIEQFKKMFDKIDENNDNFSRRKFKSKTNYDVSKNHLKLKLNEKLINSLNKNNSICNYSKDKFGFIDNESNNKTNVDMNNFIINKKESVHYSFVDSFNDDVIQALVNQSKMNENEIFDELEENIEENKIEIEKKELLKLRIINPHFISGNIKYNSDKNIKTKKKTNNDDICVTF